ncbi:MAG: hypothetical protein ACHP9T_06945 [Caulobacterales bacterium]|jgi:hypothetical protein
MKSLLFISACGLALTGLAACAPTTPPTARVALDCPSNQGDLKLSNVAPDKKTCLYTTSDGDQVSLRLIPVSSGAYQAALQPIEQELQGEIGTAKDTGADQAPSAAATAKVSAGAAADAAKAAKQAAADAAGAVGGKASTGTDSADKEDGGKADADDSSGDQANIDLPGIHIHANGDDDKANIDIGGVHIDGGDNGATIRTSHDVRLRGQALSRERNGFMSTFLLARDDLKDGWRAVGYEAAGPKAGPITVAVFKAREMRHNGASEDVKRLVRRNGGV